MTLVSLWLRPEVSPRVRKNKSRSPNLTPRHPFGGSSAHAGYSVRVSVEGYLYAGVPG